jgi:S-adenosylmethionine decarboxylase
MVLILRIFVLCCISCSLFAQEQEDYQFKGIHFLASYCDCDQDALCSVEALDQAVHDAVKQCGATILQSSRYLFPPYGMTMVILLSESHASIHTYPEHGACFVDLFTCGENCSAEKFDAALRAYLKPEHVDQRILIRDRGILEK